MEGWCVGQTVRAGAHKTSLSSLLRAVESPRNNFKLILNDKIRWAFFERSFLTDGVFFPPAAGIQGGHLKQGLACSPSSLAPSRALVKLQTRLLFLQPRSRQSGAGNSRPWPPGDWPG